LEWIAIAPESLRPCLNQVRAAMKGLLLLIDDWSDFDIQNEYLSLSHLARALCLLKSRPAAAFL
jgi:hypothetical protein